MNNKTAKFLKKKAIEKAKEGVSSPKKIYKYYKMKWIKTPKNKKFNLKK